MNIEELLQYCLSKKEVTEHLPFDNNVLVFKVLDKIFLLTGLDTWEKNQAAINLKCNPDYAQELRAEYESVEPGYHMNKKHWNTLQLHKNELKPELIKQLIDHSYQLVVEGMPKKKRDFLKLNSFLMKRNIILKIHLIISILIIIPAAFVYGFFPDTILQLAPKTLDEHNFYKAIMGLYILFAISWTLGIFKYNFTKYVFNF